MKRTRRLIDALLLHLSAISGTLAVLSWAVTLRLGEGNMTKSLMTWRWIFAGVWAAGLAVYVLFPNAGDRREAGP